MLKIVSNFAQGAELEVELNERGDFIEITITHARDRATESSSLNPEAPTRTYTYGYTSWINFLDQHFFTSGRGFQIFKRYLVGLKNQPEG